MPTNTLKKRSEFLEVSRAKNIVRRQNLWVQCCAKEKNSEKMHVNPDTSCRVGYTASKKVGNAIFRNRGKRRMREVYRNNLKYLLSNHPNFKGNIVLVAVPSTVTCSYEELSSDFLAAADTCLRRLSSQKIRNS
jgi:ribonuclease P protein component